MADSSILQAASSAFELWPRGLEGSYRGREPAARVPTWSQLGREAAAKTERMGRQT